MAPSRFDDWFEIERVTERFGGIDEKGFLPKELKPSMFGIFRVALEECWNTAQQSLRESEDFITREEAEDEADARYDDGWDAGYKEGWSDCENDMED